MSNSISNNLQMIHDIRKMKELVEEGDSAGYADYRDYVGSKGVYFDIWIDRDMAILILENDLLPRGWLVMSEEYCSDMEGWSSIEKDDIRDDMENFEIMIY